MHAAGDATTLLRVSEVKAAGTIGTLIVIAPPHRRTARR